jgi:hypothetical protein
MRYLYKYPQSAFPYTDLVQTNARRSRHEAEYELIDTGVFEDDRYFDVVVEYAKAEPEDLLIRITATNRGPAPATLHVLPTLWFRNTWSVATLKPDIALADGPEGTAVVIASHTDLGARHLYCERPTEVLFTENETNTARLFGTPNATMWTKDAFHEYVVHGRRDAVNPGRRGTKAAALYAPTVAARGRVEIRLRLTPEAPSAMRRAPFGADFDVLVDKRRREADDFYTSLTPPAVGEDAAGVMRQALAGMLWSKQYYEYDVARWLEEHGVDPHIARDTSLRNAAWSHMQNADIISMPDKWEYPWYAAWDLAFHTIALNMVDPDFAKEQLLLVLEQRYLHPSGQMPAYEWNFGDVNPPVHAWAAWFIYSHDKIRRGEGDVKFLEMVFQRLLMNFTWWVNRKDPHGHNVFEGGFLGLDNIGVFDRSAPLPTGGRLEQADGTAWMAFYAQTMLQLAIELALHDPVYQTMATKFYEHFLWIASAMDRGGTGTDLWDEQDGFFYDLLRLPSGEAIRLKVRSMVGLLSLCASTVFPPGIGERLPLLIQRVREFTVRRPVLISRIASPGRPGYGDRRLLALLTDDKLRRVLRYLLDENEFLSPFGIRAVSKVHRDHPYVFDVNGASYRVDYEPAESTSGMFGGNSNWRGPIWFPMNVLVLRALINLYAYYGKDFTVECPTGSGRFMNLYGVAHEINRRLMSIFLRDEQGARPVHGGVRKFQCDDHWRDLILFYEYFHGDNGAGIGASHQTGWTGLIAPLIQLFGAADAETYLRAEPQRASVYRAPARIAS